MGTRRGGKRGEAEGGASGVGKSAKSPGRGAGGVRIVVETSATYSWWWVKVYLPGGRITLEPSYDYETKASAMRCARTVQRHIAGSTIEVLNVDA